MASATNLREDQGDAREPSGVPGVNPRLLLHLQAMFRPAAAGRPVRR